MLSKLANNRFICQGCCNHHRARAEKRLSKQEMETDLKDWDAFFFFFHTHLPIGLKNIPIPWLKSLSFWQFVMSNKFAG